ncbi:hypothetical protein B0H14DRAFT_2603890 [Mycena olivaceomarginata]|nr:hypothetical protein B0H14DRAFT_2603890 [Mycena olivaceomarginata]
MGGEYTNGGKDLRPSWRGGGVWRRRQGSQRTDTYDMSRGREGEQNKTEEEKGTPRRRRDSFPFSALRCRWEFRDQRSARTKKTLEERRIEVGVDRRLGVKSASNETRLGANGVKVLCISRTGISKKDQGYEMNELVLNERTHGRWRWGEQDKRGSDR